MIQSERCPDGHAQSVPPDKRAVHNGPRAQRSHPHVLVAARPKACLDTNLNLDISTLKRLSKRTALRFERPAIAQRFASNSL